MIQTKTTSVSQTWTSLLRIKVGQTVIHNGIIYISATGINIEPGLTGDFEVVRETSVIDIEFIYVEGVSYKYVKMTSTGTKDVPVQYDEAQGGIEDSTDEDDNPIKIYRSLVYNAGTPGDLSSWWVKEIKQFK